MTIPTDKETRLEAIRADADVWRDDVPLDTQARVFQALIDIMPDRIYAKDAQSRFILANKAVARITSNSVKPVRLCILLPPSGCRQ